MSIWHCLRYIITLSVLWGCFVLLVAVIAISYWVLRWSAKRAATAATVCQAALEDKVHERRSQISPSRKEEILPSDGDAMRIDAVTNPRPAKAFQGKADQMPAELSSGVASDDRGHSLGEGAVHPRSSRVNLASSPPPWVSIIGHAISRMRG